MIVADGVSIAFGAAPVLKSISFEIAKGERVGLVGPSGSGKSVLLKLLGKVIEPDSGTLSYRGFAAGDSEETVDATEGVEAGFLFQEGALFDSMSVLDNVLFPLRNGAAREKVSGLSREQLFDRAMQILEQVGLSRAYRKLPGQLSGGMRRRVGIARALIARPQLVLLDDPTGGLDPVAATAIMNLVEELHEEYSPTTIMVSHDIRRLLPRVSKVLGLFDGEVSCYLAPEDLAEKAPSHVKEFLSRRFEFVEAENHDSQ